jgi:hypothetical protein
MTENVEWYESEAVDKIFEFLSSNDHINLRLVYDAMTGCRDIDDFKFSLNHEIDRTINDLERLRELVKALE